MVCDKQDLGRSFCLQKALLALYFGGHRRFKEASKRAFKIVKGKTNWISPARLKRLGLLHRAGMGFNEGLTSQRGEGAPKRYDGQEGSGSLPCPHCSLRSCCHPCCLHFYRLQ